MTKDKMTKENEKRVMVQSWSIFTVMCKQTGNSMVPKPHFSAQLIHLNLSIDLASTWNCNLRLHVQPRCFVDQS
jgi:hypothetical protein